MASSYTSNLRLTLPVTGELTGTWGDTVNTGITALVDAAVSGTAAVTHDNSANYTLTVANGASDEARQMVLNITGTLTAARNVVCPSSSKLYFVKNATTGGFAVTLKTSAGTGISVPNGKIAVLYCDGTNVVSAVTYIPNIDTASLTATTADINGGTVDGTVIGGTTAAAVTGTTLKANTSLQLATGSTVTAILDEDNMSSNSPTAIATQQSIKAYVDAQISANNELSEILVNGNTTGGRDIAVSAGDDITFTDTSKAIFGTGSDLQVYHDGSNSYIVEGGTGALNVQTNSLAIKNAAGTETMVAAAENGAVTLYYDNASKLATTSTGVDVTGTVDVTSIEVTNLKAKDGTSAGSIANTTGVVTLASSVLTTADINGGTIDGTVIGGSSAAVGTFTTATATTGNITTVNATTVDTTNLEVTSLKAKDGTSAGSIANTTGVVTLASSVLTTTDINGGTIDGTVIGGSTAAAVTATTLTATADSSFTSTGAVKVSVGTTAQRPAGADGKIRYNSTLSRYEGYSNSAWNQIGGGATGGGTDQVFFENDITVTTSYTITTNKNAVTAGPITINTGVTVTVPTGSSWSIV